MPGRIHMDMDAAAVIDLGTAPAKLPHQLLDGLHVLVFADRGHHLHRVQAAGSPLPSCLTADAGITDHLPPSALTIRNGISIIAAAHMGGFRSEVLCNDLRRRIAGNAGHFDLDTEVLGSQPGSPPSPLSCCPI